MVRLGKTLLFCGTKPTPWLTSLFGLTLVMSCAVESHRSGPDVHQTEHRLEQGRLAGTVGADDADELAALGVEVAAVEDVDPGDVASDEVVGDDQGVGGAARCAERSIVPSRPSLVLERARPPRG